MDTKASAKFIVSSIEGCIMTAKTFQDKGVLENCFKLIKDYQRGLMFNLSNKRRIIINFYGEGDIKLCRCLTEIKRR